MNRPGPSPRRLERLIHEVARMLGKDEVDFRMEYPDTDRQRAVLEKCAQESQWGKKVPAGVAQVIGMHDECKSPFRSGHGNSPEPM